MEMEFFCHESSYIDGGAMIGKGTKIWHFCHIQKNAEIGENCVIGQNVNIGSNVKVGNNVKIQNNVSVYEGITIEDDVFVGPSVVFTNVINPRSFVERKDDFRQTLICQGATIGANATVVCGNIIGAYSMVGAGSVVTRYVDAYTIVYGVPAVQHGKVDKQGNKI